MSKRDEPAGAKDDSPELPYSLAGKSNPWLMAGVVSIATFMEVLDTSIANVSLRYIAGTMAASVDESTWVLTSYLVSNAIVLPVSGWLANVLGRKRFYMGCVALFTVSSLCCGLAPTLGWLIVARVFQGAGGGGLAPSEQSILADSFPPAKRGMAFAVYGVAVVVAPTIGPTLGGWISDNYDWHWIFFLNVPCGLLSLSLSYFVLSEPPAEKENRQRLLRRGLRVDYVGFGLVALGLGCLQVVLDKGQEDDWFGSHFILTFSIVSAVSLFFLVLWEMTREDPIVDLPLLFGNRGFLAANIVMLATGLILFGTTQLLPQLVQDVMGYTAELAGLVITPGGLAVMMMMPLVGFLLGRVQPRNLILCGFAIEAVALFRMTGLDTNAAYENVMWDRVIQAAGIAFLFVPVSTASYIGLPPEKSNTASALINLARNLGGSIGISLGQTMLARRGQFHQSRLVEHLTPYQHTVQEFLQQTTQIVPGAGSEGTRLSILNQLLQRQVLMLSYIDVFQVLACISLVMLPLVFLLRKATPGQEMKMH